MSAEEPDSSDHEVELRNRWFSSYIEALEERSVTAPPGQGPYRCPCCHFLTLEERGGYDICGVCFWEDDGQDDPYADGDRGGPNPCSLSEARVNFQQSGSCHPRYVSYVRSPLPREI